MYNGRPVMKLSSGKISLAGPKQVFRQRTKDGFFKKDLIGLLDEDSWQDAIRRIKAQLDTWDQLDMEIIGRQAFVAEVGRIRAADR